MKNIKKLVALGLAALLALSTVACGEETGSSQTGASTSTKKDTGAKREITIGSWWRQYYDSTDETMDVSSDWVNAQFKDDDDEAAIAEKTINQKVALAKWNKVATLEEKYNLSAFKWVNLTYAGTKESINTSILAGSPDCDIYMVDTGMAIPAQMNGLLVDLKTIVPADHDLFTNQDVFSYLDLGDGKACVLQVQGNFSNTYPLGFNYQMVMDAGLEDPRDLYARGEWTWDKFIEYCQKLTQDTDGDNQTDQYGFCGFLNDSFRELCFSNGTTVAGGATETLSSAATGEVLQFLSDMYNKYNVCYPYDSYANGGDPSSSMRNQYQEGNVAFFPIAVWIQNGNGNYPAENNGIGNIEWDTAFVQWPVGPSGNAATNPGFNAIDGQFFVIPAGVTDPEATFNFLYDLYNWFENDTDFRSDPATLNWWYNETGKEKEFKDANFEVQKWCLGHPGTEFLESLGTSLNLEYIMTGEYTPAQFQETYKQEVQDALTSMFGN